MEDSKLQKIFINVPVSALEPAIAFYTAIGFTPNPKFSDPTTMMMVLSPTIYVMLILPERFTGFMPDGRTICDAKKTNEILFCLSAESKDAVDDTLTKAAGAGGKVVEANKRDMNDVMYSRKFEDLEGHVWTVMWMSAEAVANPDLMEEQGK